MLLLVERVNVMSACNCGHAPRAVSLTKWALPATILALVPKCPACVAAYVLLATGMGISIPAATVLRTGVIVVCSVTLATLLVHTVMSRRARVGSRGNGVAAAP